MRLNSSIAPTQGVLLLVVAGILCCTAQSDLSSRCDTCREIVKKFKSGIVKTAKSNFGGGNTQWEEKNLGSYAFSETRLLEILESVCPRDSSRECHHMVEANEEIIENWWFKHYAKGVDIDLNEYLCVSRMRVCCPSGTYGMTCRECTGGRSRPCKGNGRCVGEGTRTGSGKCTCNPGYTGDLCDVCADGYYEEFKNETHTVCEQCHGSCKHLCDEGGPRGCDDCRDGWQLTENEGCVDENECEDDALCAENEYCLNTEGSYKCMMCSKACSKCTSSSSSDCIECADKYFPDVKGVCKPCHVSCSSSCSDETSKTCDACIKGWKIASDGSGCQDVDECSSPKRKPCSSDEYCINTVGSYKCSTCHPSCVDCSGPGNDQCIECKPGFAFSDQHQCLDIDECNTNQANCDQPHQRCINLPGSFKCDCEQGFVLTDNGCAVKTKETQRTTTDSFKPALTTKKPSSPNPSKKSPAPQAKSKSSARDKAKEKFLNNSKWMYLSALIGFVIFCNILRKYVVVQSFLTAALSAYIYWLAPQIDQAVVKSTR